MGTRYILEITCPDCGEKDKEVYFAPTCGVKTWKCPKCHRKVNLEKLTGITAKKASNKKEINKIIKTLAQMERSALEQ